MNIGEAALASGLSAKKIRYYEAAGIIHPAGRRASGYRQYEADDVHRLRFVRYARNSGLSLETIRALLSLWGASTRGSAATKVVALAHVAALESRLSDTYAMLDTLRQLAKTGTRRRDERLGMGDSKGLSDVTDATRKKNSVGRPSACKRRVSGKTHT